MYLTEQITVKRNLPYKKILKPKASTNESVYSYFEE